MEETQCAVQRRANDLSHVASLSESTPSLRSTAPSTDTGSYPQANTSSTSPPTSIFEYPDLDGDPWTAGIRRTGLTSDIEVIEICQGTFVAIDQEPSNEDKLQWRAVSKRLHMAFAKTCKRYPNLSLQFKLAGASADSLQPMIFFVCPEETQKKVRKFVKKQKWLSEAECGYKYIILDGNFLRVALDGEGGLDGGLFIHADMNDAQTLCGKLGRLEGTLDHTGGGSRFTIGGVVVVNDTLCCLTAGHVLFDGPSTSEMASSDEEDETDEEEEPRSPAGARHTPPQSHMSSDPLLEKSDEADMTQNQVSEETRVGKLLTTSNWKRGILASNEDWSLIQLDAVCSTDKWIVNQFQCPATEVQDSLKVTIDKLALTEAEITGAEVMILAGCSGLQKGRLNTTSVQLYLDNATFEAREIATHEPLKMGDSGSWVVQGSKLLGHVFAVQDGTPWSYMIPISQVIEDIQKSLLTCSIELPTTENQAETSLVCPKAGRTHASLVAFGVTTCPSCKQDMRYLGHSREKDLSLKDASVEDQVLLGDDEGSESVLTESHASSDYSDSIKASTVPTSYVPVSRVSAYKASPDKYDAPQYIPFLGTFVYQKESDPIDIPLRLRGKVPFVELKAVLDEVQPPNVALERLIKTDANILLDLDNPINDNVRTTHITLITPWLNNAFRHVVRWDPLTDQRSRQIVLREPYAVLVHHLPQLTACASEIRATKSAEKANFEGSRLREHSVSAKPQLPPQHEEIEALIAFTQRFIDASDIAAEYSRYERNACTFKNLWLLFHPGMTVYARDNDSRGLAAFIVRAVDTDPSILRHPYGVFSGYCIHMWRLNYDGQYVDRESCSVEIDYFDGERDITTLKAFPCKYLDKADGGKARRELEEQGRKWYQLLRGGATYYSGTIPETADLKHDGQVLVDRNGIRDGLLNPDNKMLPFNDEPDYLRARREDLEFLEALERQCPSLPWSSYSKLNPEMIEDLELPGEPAEGKGHRYLLCAPYLPGFFIKEKKWAWVDVQYCSQLKTDRSALDRLVLPPQRKEIIRIVVEEFKQSTSSELQYSQRQRPRRKLVMLLQGNSGTGKTYTAECLAEAEGKGLMTIHPGEIGSDSESPRDLLSLWLRLAQTSDAIVLVPAADSFLEQTPAADRGRSDVFSVFWACLESYRGIVILTTSRVSLPSEVMSRIDLPVYYPPLDIKARLQIGKQILRDIEESRSPQISTEAEARWEANLPHEELNGHEIKSILENALAMASNRHRDDRDEPPSCILNAEDIKAAAQSRRTFKDHVKVSLNSELPQGRQQQAGLGAWPAQSPYSYPPPAQSYYPPFPAPYQYGVPSPAGSQYGSQSYTSTRPTRPKSSMSPPPPRRRLSPPPSRPRQGEYQGDYDLYNI